MQEFTLQHANTFFFITTIAVGILIVILLAFLYLIYKVIRFARKSMDRVDNVLDQVSEHTEVHPMYKKSFESAMVRSRAIEKKLGKAGDAPALSGGDMVEKIIEEV